MDKLKPKIITQFSALCSISLPAAAGFTELIEQSIKEVSSMLREGILPSEHEASIIHLCSAICCYRYCLQKLLNQPDNVRAADISVSHNSGKMLENAKRIKDEAVISAKGILKDDNFYFGRVN